MIPDNYKDRSLESLENHTWPAPAADEGSYLIGTCHALRKKKLNDFEVEDLRIMISQEIGLEFLLPLAIERLRENLFAEGDMYEGDLLKSVLDLDKNFWRSHEEFRNCMLELIESRKTEVLKMKFDLTRIME